MCGCLLCNAAEVAGWGGPSASDLGVSDGCSGWCRLYDGSGRLTRDPQALCENTTLKELDLSFNHIGPDGAVALGKIRCTNTSLQKLFRYDDTYAEGL